MTANMTEQHKVIIEPGARAPAIRFTKTFNVAVPFIDRHVAEGRGEHVALRSTAGDITYTQLAANVARCGNALKSLGIGRG